MWLFYLSRIFLLLKFFVSLSFEVLSMVYDTRGEKLGELSMTLCEGAL